VLGTAFRAAVLGGIAALTFLLPRSGLAAAESDVPAWAQSWMWTTADLHFPARVRVVVFPNGAVLDSRRTVQLGQWSVSFGPNPSASAQITPTPKIWNFYSADRHVFIEGLYCSNALAGKMPCNMHLNAIDYGTFCWLNIPGGVSRTPNMYCPAEIYFR